MIKQIFDRLSIKEMKKVLDLQSKDFYIAKK
jgi:hypothetical protein